MDCLLNAKPPLHYFLPPMSFPTLNLPPVWNFLLFSIYLFLIRSTNTCEIPTVGILQRHFLCPPESHSLLRQMEIAKQLWPCGGRASIKLYSPFNPIPNPTFSRTCFLHIPNHTLFSHYWHTVLRYSHFVPRELIVYISSQFCVQWLHISCLKLITVRVFTPQELAKAFFLENRFLNTSNDNPSSGVNFWGRWCYIKKVYLYFSK
jgi:hypothetical protein